MKVVDLTHELRSESLPALYGSDFHSIVSQGRILVTHIEAPAYLMHEGKKLIEFEPQSFVRDAVLLDLTSVKPREFIDDEHLEAAEEAAGLALREGELLIIRTGWDRHASSEEYWSDYPALSENGAEYLEFKRVGGVGIDTPSVDPAQNRTLSAHLILLRNGILVLENLCNLDEIDVERFRLVALPLKIAAATSPVRAVALLGETAD